MELRTVAEFAATLRGVIAACPFLRGVILNVHRLSVDTLGGRAGGISLRLQRLLRGHDLPKELSVATGRLRAAGEMRDRSEAGRLPKVVLVESQVDSPLGALPPLVPLVVAELLPNRTASDEKNRSSGDQSCLGPLRFADHDPTAPATSCSHVRADMHGQAEGACLQP